KISIASLLIVFSHLLHAQKNEIYCEVEVVNLGTLQNVEVAFEVARLAEENKPTGIIASYEIIHEGNVIESKNLDLNTISVEKINSTFYFNFIIEQVTYKTAQLRFLIKDMVTEKSLYKKIALKKGNQHVSFGFKNYSKPLNRNFLVSSESFILKDVTNKPVHLIQFKHNFLPAAPPMGNNMSGGGRGLSVDSVITVNTNQAIVLNSEALYFAQEDTSSTKGMGFRVVSEDFPKFKNVENLAHSMIYISTNKEINSFLSAPDKKAALDNFWINSGGNVEVAKRMIKEYYQRVTYANKNFTNYKQGWKTDRGMIYIVFGRPEEVIAVENGQQWVYFLGKKRKRVTFEFVKRPNLFSGLHYELFRSPQYKKVYFQAVEKWRNGAVFLP
ncbi:MAG: GWxTD domain-containing protein, partial [Bacteroidota bacterium]